MSQNSLLNWLKPTHRLASLLEITPEWLALHKINGLLLDIDNTLVPHGFEGELPELERWVNALRQAGIRMRIVSNARPQRIKRWSNRLGIASVGALGIATAFKPWPTAFRRALAELQLPAADVLMVGDQVFTDVLGGNVCGCRTVFLQPLNDDGMPHTKFARQLERWVLNRFGS